MRAGGCSVQQSLSVEAATTVKQAVVLAKRRGHAQVTPLHVASTMLSAAAGMLRAACLQSHSHPWQCKALELCFNVALNRLPASSSSSSVLGQQPSTSNALVAAFKRAQAHQRRGSIETNQPPIVTVRIEVEQLMISILDDPSVSRVMREAGFSSTQVKANVESQSGSRNSPPPAPRRKTEPVKVDVDDVGTVVETLLTFGKRKSLVLVGECISKLESTVKKLMNRVGRGDVAEDFRDVQFISIPPLHSFCNIDRDLVQRKMGELACLVKSLVRHGAVLYFGDFNWISDYQINLERRKDHYYCSVQHVIMEIGRLVSGIGETGRFWLVGIATFETYMRCRNGCNSLESIWGLHPLTLGSNSLSLTLISPSDGHNRYDQLQMRNGCGKLSCGTNCSTKCVADGPLCSLLPWLKDENRGLNNNNNQNCGSICENWNSYYNTLGFSYDQQNPNQLQNGHCHCNTLTALQESGDTKQAFPSKSNLPSSSVITETVYTHKFKEFNAQNLNILCDALEKKVPWQRNIIPEIAGTVLQSRSRMLRRKLNTNLKEETWLMFLGPDVRAKDKISMEMAKVVFGSYSNLVSIEASCVDSPEDHLNKRCGDEESYIERFAQAVSVNPHRVFLLEDLDRADYDSIMAIKTALEYGSIGQVNGCGEIGLCDAIIIFSCERFGCGARLRSPPLDLNISFDEGSFENPSVDDLGILQSVDRSVIFQL